MSCEPDKEVKRTGRLCIRVSHVDMPRTRQVLQTDDMAFVRGWGDLECVLHVEGLVARSDMGTVFPDHSCFKEPRISKFLGHLLSF